MTTDMLSARSDGATSATPTDASGAGDSAGAPAAKTAARPGPGRRGRPESRRRAWWAAAAIFAVLLIGVLFRPTPLDVQVATVGVGPLETTIDADGVTRVLQRFQVAAPVAGQLERITLREGDAVEAGMVIARLTPLALDERTREQSLARVSVAQALLREAQARVAQTDAAREQAERTAGRLEAVAGAGGFSVDALERVQLEMRTAQREHEAALSRVGAATAELGAAWAALLGSSGGTDPTAVRSPASGTVLRVHEPSARAVAAGTPLVEIGDAAGLEVVADVLSTDAVKIPVGAPVRVMEWGGEGSLPARVRRVEPAGFVKLSALGVSEQRVNVLIELDTPPAALGDGYHVGVQVVTWQADDVLRVPVGALFRTGEGWMVFVAEQGRARLRPVEIGRRGAAEAEVVSGLQSGDRVILFPSDRLADGSRIRS
jgi:HlyD family secretion protein